MKKSLLLVLSMILASVGIAQQQLATLNHGGNVTVYYGQSALSSAHSAAVAGDIITLSGGTFNDVTITKNVTIRGTGILADSLCPVPTYIGKIRVSTPEDSNHHLTLEGIRIYELDTYNGSCYNMLILKCFINFFGYNGSIFYNPTIINSMIKNWHSSIVQNAIVYNSAIDYYDLGVSYSSSAGQNAASFYNSVVYVNYSINSLYVIGAINSILIYGGNGDGSAQNGATSFNCIGVTSANSNYYGNSFLSSNHLYNYHGYSSVFKYYNGGGFTYNTSFELQDSIATTILGNDSTQVGLYGGLYPFNLRVRNPQIIRCNVSHTTTSDGKLPVDLHVVSE